MVPSVVTTPLGGLYIPFVWRLTRKVRRALAEGGRVSPIHALFAIVRDCPVARLLPAELQGRTVVVALDVVRAGLGDRALMMQLAHAAQYAGANVRLVYTCSERDPAYQLKPQQTARFLRDTFAPPGAELHTSLDTATEKADFLVWASNVPDAQLPADLRREESFGTWAESLGLPLAKAVASLPLAPRSHVIGRLAAQHEWEGPYALLQLGAGTHAALVPHAASLATRFAKEFGVTLVTYGPVGAYYESNDPDVKVANLGSCSLDTLVALISGATRGFGPESGPLHLAGLMRAAWTISYREQPFTAWWTAHYDARVNRVAADASGPESSVAG